MDTQIQIQNFLSIMNIAVHGQDVLLSDPNWRYLLELASQHSLLPMFVKVASKYPEFQSLKNYSPISKKAMFAVAYQVKSTGSFLELYKAFSNEGIYPIVMKGLICRQLYIPYDNYRPSGDEDILIQIKDYVKVKKILEDSGYHTTFEVEPSQLTTVQEIPFKNVNTGLLIELHLNPIGCENDFRVKMNNYFKSVFKNYREVEINGVKIRTMSHTDHFLYLVLHAFKHFTSGGFGIRQMLDILLYDEKYGNHIDWKYLIKVFDELKITDFISDLISIGNQYIGFDLKLLSNPKCPNDLLDDIISCGVFGSETKVQQTSIQFTNAAMANKDSDSILRIIHTAFPGRAYMQTFNPEINDKPWLIVPEWGKRIGRFIKRKNNYDGNLMTESMELSNKRIKLLKKYGVL